MNLINAMEELKPPNCRESVRLRKEFFLAVRRKRVGRVTELIKNGVDPNCVYDDTINGGVTAIHSSVLANSFEMVQCLIENGANVNLADRDGETPIFATLFGCDERIRHLLFEKGADANFKDKSGKTPLMKTFEDSEMFSCNVSYSVISAFLTRSSDFQQKDKDGCSLLHLVSVIHDGCYIGSNEAHNCRSYLDYLVESGRLSIHGTSPDCTGQTPLHKAASSCCFEAVQFLIERGCDPTLRDNSSKTALHCLGAHPDRSDFTQIIKLLLKAGCNINATDYMGRIPLHYVTASTDTCREAVEAMISHGAIVDKQDKCGHNPLHLCVHPADVFDNSDVVGDKEQALHIADVVEALVHNGIGIDDTDHDMFTPLHFAVRQRNVRAVKTLLCLGADPYLTTKTGETALHRATISTNILDTIIDYLKKTDKGVVMNVTDNYGSTPLHWAVSLLEPGAADRLLNEGCQHLPDRIGRSPADLACLFKQACFYESLGIRYHRNVFPIDFEKTSLRKHHLMTLFPARDSTDDEMEKSETILTHNEEYDKEVEDDDDNDGLVLEETMSHDGSTDDDVDQCPGKDELYINCLMLQTIRNENQQVSLIEWKTHLVFHQSSLSSYSKIILDSKDMGLEIDTHENEDIAMVIFEIMTSISTYVSTVEPVLKCDVSLAGSRSEGTKICCPNEFDLSWNLTCFSEAFFVEETASCPHEFVQLRIKEEFKNTKFAEFVTEDYTLDGRKLIRFLYTTINETLFRQKNDSFRQMYCRKYLGIDKGSIDNLAFRWVGNVYKDLLVEVDIVPRLVFPGWVPNQIDLNSALYKSIMPDRETAPAFAVVIKTPDGKLVKDWQHYFRIDVAQLESKLIREARKLPEKDSYC